MADILRKQGRTIGSSGGSSGGGGLTEEEHDWLEDLHDRMDSFVNLDSFDSSRILYDNRNAPATVTLNNLIPNHVYLLVYAWSQTSSYYSASIETEVVELYKDYGLSEDPAGSGKVGPYLICIFKAISTELTVYSSRIQGNSYYGKLLIADLTDTTS